MNKVRSILLCLNFQVIARCVLTALCLEIQQVTEIDSINVLTRLPTTQDTSPKIFTNLNLFSNFQNFPTNFRFIFNDCYRFYRNIFFIKLTILYHIRQNAEYITVTVASNRCHISSIRRPVHPPSRCYTIRIWLFVRGQYILGIFLDGSAVCAFAVGS